jgi:hypothetical protein
MIEAVKLKGLSGPEKRDIVMSVLRGMVDKIDDEDEKESCRLILDLMGPLFIDLVYGISTGKIKVPNLKNFKCFKCLK